MVVTSVYEEGQFLFAGNFFVHNIVMRYETCQFQPIFQIGHHLGFHRRRHRLLSGGDKFLRQVVVDIADILTGAGGDDTEQLSAFRRLRDSG